MSDEDHPAPLPNFYNGITIQPETKEEEYLFHNFKRIHEQVLNDSFDLEPGEVQALVAAIKKHGLQGMFAAKQIMKYAKNHKVG